MLNPYMPKVAIFIHILITYWTYGVMIISNFITLFFEIFSEIQMIKSASLKKDARHEGVGVFANCKKKYFYVKTLARCKHFIQLSL